MAMPFALARPYVDKYITDDVRTNVSGALIRMFYISCDIPYTIWRQIFMRQYFRETIFS